MSCVPQPGLTERLRSAVLASVLALGLSACSEAPAPQFSVSDDARWQNYDQSAELAGLQQLDNESMHFLLLNSRLRDRNLLWQQYNTALDAFGEERYRALNPLVAESSIATLQQAVQAGQLSYEELTLFYLYRIREIESDRDRYLNAVIATSPDALAEARARDAALNSGTPVAADSLFGIPVLLKDNIGAVGMPTTAGAAVLQDNHTRDAFITARLRNAGAVILGKTNLSEWAYFFCRDCPSGYSATGGQTLNPYGRLRFSTGGSSSGSGAAVAANLAAVTVGTETSGSILSPASLQSAVGFKPTTGRLSRSGIVPISSTLDTPGPITRSVADAIALFSAMSGHDAEDPAMDPQAAKPASMEKTGLPGQRLGYFADWLSEPLYAAAVETLQSQGAELIPLTLADTSFDGFQAFLAAEMKDALPYYLQNHAASAVPQRDVAAIVEFNEQDPQRRAPYGEALFELILDIDPEAGEKQALGRKLKTAALQRMQQILGGQQTDALLSLNNRFAGMASLINYPALTLPLGLDADGIPQGLTLYMPSWHDEELLGLGLAVEAAVGNRQPPEHYR